MPNRGDALYRADQVRELDRLAIESHGIPGYTLMRRAGAACWALIERRWPQAEKLLIVCGVGNNGGDGFVIGRLALAAGRTVTLCIVGDADRIRGDAATARQHFVDAGGRIQTLGPETDEAELVVDALLGTGTDRPVEGDMATAIRRINAMGRPVLAVDVPSGLQADTGQRLGESVCADATVSMIGHKLGVFTGAGPDCAGSRHLADLEVPDAIYDAVPAVAHCIPNGLVRHCLPPRPRDSHKNAQGHCLLVGGDHGMGGAIRLSAEACFRSGAGLVTVATRAAQASEMTQACPEVMCAGVESDADADHLLDRASVLGIGPGLGLTDWGRMLWTRVLKSEKPKVVDADALTLLAETKDAPVPDALRVLTPHPGEAARLLGVTTAEIQSDRLAAARALQQRYGGAVVLKGAGSIVIDTAGDAWVCPRGNPGMAVAGMGDALTGVIAALLAQGFETSQAAVLGVDIHARAGDLAALNGERGMMTRDLIDCLRNVVNP